MDLIKEATINGVVYRHGDYVECNLKGIYTTDARISIDKNDDVFVCQNDKEGSRGDEMFGYTYSWVIFRSYSGILKSEFTRLKLKKQQPKKGKNLNKFIVTMYPTKTADAVLVNKWFANMTAIEAVALVGKEKELLAQAQVMEEEEKAKKKKDCC